MKPYSHSTWQRRVAVIAAWILMTCCALAEAPPATPDADGPNAWVRVITISVCAAATVIFCVFAAAYAVGRIGTAALGAAAEKPELLVRSVVLVALAEGLAVLGFAIAMMMVQKL